MTKLRWGADAPNDTSSARSRLIDAAEACFQRYGVVKTTVEDVAATAKVSRATVYRYFADRDELILGVLLREAGRFLDRLRTEINREPDIDRAIVNGVLFTVDAVRANEHLALLFAPEAIGITTSIAGASEALFRLTTDFLRPIYEAAREAGQLRPEIDLDEAAEWTLRAVLSMLTVQGPSKRRPAEQRRFLSTFLVPALVAQPPSVSPASTTRRRSTKRAATARTVAKRATTKRKA
jgi:AcrR family transcriptional regulator